MESICEDCRFYENMLCIRKSEMVSGNDGGCEHFVYRRDCWSIIRSIDEAMDILFPVEQ